MLVCVSDKHCRDTLVVQFPDSALMDDSDDSNLLNVHIKGKLAGKVPNNFS